MNDIGGVWRTIGGRRVFIKDGEDLATAMKNSGKFGNKKEEHYNPRKEVSYYLNKGEFEKADKIIKDYALDDEREEFMENMTKGARADYKEYLKKNNNLEPKKTDDFSKYKQYRDEFKELFEKDPETARTIFLKELGYGDKPKLVNEEEFNKINDKDNPVMQRSTSDEGYDSLVNGEYRTSSLVNSMYGTGIYFAYGEDDKEYYAKLANTTKVFEARVDKSAKMIDSRKLKEKEDDIRNKLGNDKERIDSVILADNGILAGFLGYDGIYFDNVKYGLVLNRGKLIIKK